MPQLDEIREEKEFLNCTSRLQEHFKDYLLIVRRNDGSLRWKHSDAIWAMGSTQAFEDVTRNRNLE